MLRQLRNTIFLIIVFFLLYNCNNQTNTGNRENSNGKKIVSLAQSLTKELEDLGLTSSIVGATSYCDLSKQNPDLIIGTSTEVNVEKILLLKPDLVVASILTSQATISALKANGLNVYVSPKMDSYDAICKHFINLGKLVGKEEFADSLVSDSKKKIDSLQQSLPGSAPKYSVFFQIGANPLFTVIPNTYMNDLITLAGCRNIASDFTRGTITRESVLQQNPDIIFIVTMGIAGDQEKQIWESYKELKAARNKKIFIIDSEMACTPTVNTFTKTLEVIFKNIYN